MCCGSWQTSCGLTICPAPATHIYILPTLMHLQRGAWLDTVTDEDGRFDIPGVPAGEGYTVAVTAPTVALEEVHGVSVRAGQVTALTVQAHQGAIVAGRVLVP